MTLIEGAESNGVFYVGGGGDPDMILVDFGDFDGNGIKDIVWRRNSSGAHFVTLINANSAGPFEYIGGGDGVYSVDVDDYNGDMRSDVLWWRESDNSHFITLMNGSVPGPYHYVGGGGDIDIWTFGLDDEALCGQ